MSKKERLPRIEALNARAQILALIKNAEGLLMAKNEQIADTLKMPLETFLNNAEWLKKMGYLWQLQGEGRLSSVYRTPLNVHVHLMDYAKACYAIVYQGFDREGRMMLRIERGKFDRFARKPDLEGFDLTPPPPLKSYSLPAFEGSIDDFFEGLPPFEEEKALFKVAPSTPYEGLYKGVVEVKDYGEKIYFVPIDPQALIAGELIQEIKASLWSSEIIRFD